MFAGSSGRGAEMTVRITLERAIAIAAQAHARQTDKAGAPYILHCLRVMLAQKSEAAMIVAVCHDLLEDCPYWSPERLSSAGFTDDMVEALLALTKRPGEPYLDFALRAGEDSIARRVKIADLRDNLDASRLGELTEADRERLDKYSVALGMLQPLDAAPDDFRPILASAYRDKYAEGRSWKKARWPDWSSE